MTAIVDFTNEIAIDDDVTSRMESLLALLAGLFLIGCGDGLFLWRGYLAIIWVFSRNFMAFRAFCGVFQRFPAQIFGGAQTHAPFSGVKIMPFPPENICSGFSALSYNTCILRTAQPSTATLLDGCMVHVDGPDIGGSHRGV